MHLARNKLLIYGLFYLYNLDCILFCLILQLLILHNCFLNLLLDENNRMKIRLNKFEPFSWLDWVKITGAIMP